jgi:ubiquinone/menaquinone biosynthesis C-methylase UbiE
MKTNDLLFNLREMEKKTNEEWLKNLETRKIKELEFHNRDRDKEFQQNISKDTYDKIYGNRKFYKTVEVSVRFKDKWILDNVKGKVFLDYACGNGGNARQAAKSGASLAIGIDISDISIKNAKQIAIDEGLAENTFFVQGDAENTGLPDNSIDLVICSGMLHHLDLSYAFYELRRILKPGGKVLAIEALDYNPIIKIYRMITPDMRTEWEKAHILSYRDLKFASRFFKVKNIKHWHVLSILGGYFPSILPILNFLDKIVVKIPLVKKMSWMFTFELIKD